MSDANWSNVVLRLTCNGTDASTTFTDLSPAALTVTADGSAQVDTGQSKYGGASAQFDGGSSTMLTVSASSHLAFGSGSWTIECWIRPTQASIDNSFLVFYFYAAADTNERLYIGVDYDGSVFCGVQVGGFEQSGAGEVVADVWQHLAVSYNGTTLRIFVDGTQVASGSVTMAMAESPTLIIGNQNPVTYSTSPYEGWIDDIRITKGVARYTGAFTAPAAELPTTGDIPATDAYLAVGSMLGGELILADASPAALVSDSGPLGALLATAQTDFTGAIDPSAPVRYVVDLHTPDGDVRAPVSSWQATQQVDQSCYLQCVIPACDPYVDAIADATAFTVSRRGQFIDGSAVESVMATSAITESVFSRSPSRNTCTLSGYSDAFAANDNPSATLDRTLSDVRLITTSGSGTRVRCAIDWLLRPAQRAIVDGDSFVVSFINWYANADDEFMDVGSRNDAGA